MVHSWLCVRMVVSKTWQTLKQGWFVDFITLLWVYSFYLRQGQDSQNLTSKLFLGSCCLFYIQSKNALLSQKDKLCVQVLCTNWSTVDMEVIERRIELFVMILLGWALFKSTMHRWTLLGYIHVHSVPGSLCVQLLRRISWTGSLNISHHCHWAVTKDHPLLYYVNYFVLCVQSACSTRYCVNKVFVDLNTEALTTHER